MSGSRVVLMCGPPGSGKTTYAESLQSNGWVRLSIDEEAWRLGHREMPLPDAAAVASEPISVSNSCNSLRQGATWSSTTRSGDALIATSNPSPEEADVRTIDA